MRTMMLQKTEFPGWRTRELAVRLFIDGRCEPDRVGAVWLVVCESWRCAPLKALDALGEEIGGTARNRA